MKYSKEQLIQRVKGHLKDAKSILVTTDGQVFTDDSIGKSYATAHARQAKLGDVIKITADDLKSEAKPRTKPQPKAEVKPEVKAQPETKEVETTKK